MLWILRRIHVAIMYPFAHRERYRSGTSTIRGAGSSRKETNVPPQCYWLNSVQPGRIAAASSGLRRSRCAWRLVISDRPSEQRSPPLLALFHSRHTTWYEVLVRLARSPRVFGVVVPRKYMR